MPRRFPSPRVLTACAVVLALAAGFLDASGALAQSNSRHMAPTPTRSAPARLDLTLDDTLPPELWNLSPADGATGVDPRTNVACFARDLDSGLDLGSVEVRLAGAVIPHSLTLISGRYMVVGDPPAMLADETPYTVSVTAADLADPPNGASVSWDFTTGTAQDLSQPPSPPTGLSAAVNGHCVVRLSWNASVEANVIAYRVSYGDWPDGLATALAWQTPIGAELPGLPPGQYWFGVVALDNLGQESAMATLGQPVTLGCGGDPGDGPDLSSLGQGEIWPPGVLVYDPAAPLSVAKLGRGWAVRIFTVSGRLVYEFRAESEGEDFTWNLLNREGSRIAKGLYLVRVFEPGGSAVREGTYLRR